MDLQKADYDTVIKFGTLDDLLNKLKLEAQKLSDIIDTADANGISLFQRALICRKFEVAHYLLNENVKINVISKEGFNELHYLAANINFDGALDLARLLIQRGCDLVQIDSKYGNTALLSVCLELLKRQSDEGMKFLEEVLSNHQNIDITNKSGISVRKLLKERGPDKIKELIKEE
ncbi:MAG TPA: ankyrin repeat domain-containing protein [Lachnospiraceae bacterium]|nr:ankyrin repeat domain-containing protein [Lachnospiraceae bacterium]